MRETMQTRFLAADADRRTIMQFIKWVEKRNGGKLSILLPSGTNQDLVVGNALDEFHDIDRVRMAVEDERYGVTGESHSSS